MSLLNMSTTISLSLCFQNLVFGYGNWQKKQLSPALQLEDKINSLIQLRDLGYKRSYIGSTTHMLPSSVEFDNKLSKVMSLHDVEEGPVLNPVDQYVYNYLHIVKAGKKKSLSPAVDVEQLLQLPQMLADVGR
ncbi:unnamed protein product [Thelazia callipaeda]|uniref:Propep_M14 domain-containing protein n=1 Tax=Thelazia callipaeda TaxID=103827 RepID=A0A0N5D6V7_THECL|nr:unnamed protein product [Thelazia callipaeda]